MVEAEQLAVRARSQSRLSKGESAVVRAPGAQVGQALEVLDGGEPLAAQPAHGDALQPAVGDEAVERRGQPGVATAQEVRAHVPGARHAEHPHGAQHRRALGGGVVEVGGRGGARPRGRQRSKTSHSRSVPPMRPETPTRPDIHSRCSIRAIVWRAETSSVHQPWRHGSAERSSRSRARSGPRSRSSATSVVGERGVGVEELARALGARRRRLQPRCASPSGAAAGRRWRRARPRAPRRRTAPGRGRRPARAPRRAAGRGARRARAAGCARPR